MTLNTCRNCKTDQVSEIIDWGNQPISHNLLETRDSDEYTHPLRVHICMACGIAFIPDPCPPEKLYLDYNYNFSHWKAEPHMPDEIDMIKRGCKKKPDAIFEIGCNDGKFISQFATGRAVKKVGLEPNPHPAGMCEKKGITVIREFLGTEVVVRAVREHGRFGIVLARQVLEHLQDYALFFQCLDTLLAEGGYVFVDVPDCENGFRQGDCSIIWEEHVTYFFDRSLQNLFLDHGFELVDQRKYNFSGGIVACLFRKMAKDTVRPAKADISEFVNAALAYPKRIQSYEIRLKRFLETTRKQKRKVVLYGVGCRGTMLVNGLDIASMIDYAVDDQTERQGKFMAGSRLPIFPSDRIAEQSESVLILLAVGQENDAKVTEKIKAMIRERHCIILPASSPADIFAELEKAEVGITD